MREQEEFLMELCRMLEKIPKKGPTYMLDEFCNLRIDEALEETLRKDEPYQAATQEVNQALKRLNGIIENPEQWELLEGVSCAYNAQAARQIRLSYLQGFWDAVNLINTIK